ncbi:hypothetical protein C1280_06715 [Gemmata obscuriglobus]|uniref:Lipocalin-like domain-containing protein n=2 Tax=Gemmata obscuriglobus TaxID=114 RepID=A0A2Z3GW05_9BACT|nr:hypothetical protein C1280_06715 [Gemmata obscuriglobus]
MMSSWGAVVAQDQKRVGDGRPLAPPPREKPSTHELLVGEWQAVKTSNPAVPKLVTVTVRFNKNGTFEFETNDAKYGIRQQQGTYEVSGKVVSLKYTNDNKFYSLLAEEITKEKLVTASRVDGGRSRYEYIRKK